MRLHQRPLFLPKPDQFTYSGLPFSTSSEAMNTSGLGIPAFCSAAAAYPLVADVQMAQRGLGPLLTGSSSLIISRTPGSATMPLRPFRVDCTTIAFSKRCASRYVDVGLSKVTSDTCVLTSSSSGSSTPQ